MKYRKLRIAFSAACVIACVLLIALWVRSYKCADTFSFPLTSTHLLGASSAQGVVSGIESQYAAGYYKGPWEMLHDSTIEPSIAKVHDPQNRPGYHGILGLSFINSWPFHVLCIPYWFLVGGTLMVSYLPWRSRTFRFSLRTLLIVTTLVALLLGLFVWAAR